MTLITADSVTQLGVRCFSPLLAYSASRSEVAEAVSVAQK